MATLTKHELGIAEEVMRELLDDGLDYLSPRARIQRVYQQNLDDLVPEHVLKVSFAHALGCIIYTLKELLAQDRINTQPLPEIERR
jgi:hypothetical protein